MKISWIATGLACLFLSQAKAQYLGIQKFTQGQVVLLSGDTLKGALTHYVERDVLIVQPPGYLPQTLTASGVQSFVTNSSSTPVAISVSSVRTQRPNNTTSGIFIPVTSGAIVSQIPTSPTVQRDSTVWHQYVTLPWPAELAQQNRSAFGFFELMVLGQATLVQRLRYQEVVSVEYYGGNRDLGTGSITELLDRNNKAGHLYREVASADGVETHSQSLVSVLYLIGPTGKLQPMVNPRKEVLEMFAKHKRHIIRYMQSKNLVWQKPDDVVRIVAYANSI